MVPRNSDGRVMRGKLKFTSDRKAILPIITKIVLRGISRQHPTSIHRREVTVDVSPLIQLSSILSDLENNTKDFMVMRTLR
jgi:hypothetical protein